MTPSRSWTTELPSGFTRLDDPDEVWRSKTPSAQLAAIREQAPRLKDRIKGTGPAAEVRTFDISTLTYPALDAFSGAASVLDGDIFMRNRMQVAGPREPRRSRRVMHQRRGASRARGLGRDQPSVSTSASASAGPSVSTSDRGVVSAGVGGGLAGRRERAGPRARQGASLSFRPRTWSRPIALR